MAKYKKALLFILCIILSFALIGCGERTVVVSEHYVYESEEGEAVEASSSSPEVSSEEPSSSEVKASSSAPQSSSDSSAETSSDTVYQIPKRKVHPNDVKFITINGINFPVTLVDKLDVGEEVKRDDYCTLFSNSKTFLLNSTYQYMSKQEDKKEYIYCDEKTGWLLFFEFNPEIFKRGSSLTDNEINSIADNFFNLMYDLNINDYDYTQEFDGTTNQYMCRYSQSHCGYTSDVICMYITKSGNLTALSSNIDVERIISTIEKVEEKIIYTNFKEYLGDKSEQYEILGLEENWLLNKNKNPCLLLKTYNSNGRYGNEDTEYFIVEFCSDGSHNFYLHHAFRYK